MTHLRTTRGRTAWFSRLLGYRTRKRQARRSTRALVGNLSANRTSRLEPLEDRLLLATVVLTPSKDNTLIQEASGALSNGQGELYAGRVGENAGLTLRRGLMHFDLASAGIPATATVTNVTLVMTMSRTGPGALNDNIRLHRMTADWGEGSSFIATGRGASSAAGDATWIHNFFGTSNWTTPGGDFVGSPSANSVVPFSGMGTWSTAGMITDVVSWLNTPATNFGWLLRSDEATSEASNRNVRRFNSKDVGSNPPQLTIEFTEPASLTVAIAADEISESAGAAATTGTVTRTGDTSNALVVNLASNDASEATVAASVTIAAGQATSPAFNIDAVDDAIADGTQTVTITASASGLPNGTDTVNVTDDDVAALTLTIAADSISEAAGAGATTATVSRNTDTSSALVVNLVSSDTTEAAVQSSITIAAGQTTSPPVNIDAVDDAIVDGTQTVTMTASAAGLVDGTDAIDVTDNDVAATVTGQIVNSGSVNRSGVSSLEIQFSEAVTLGTTGVLKIWNHTLGSALDISSATLVNDGSTAVTFDLTSVAFPNGNYTAKLLKAEAGLSATHVFSFRIVVGDGDGDGQVGFADFGQLAAAFNTSGGPRYGPGDFDGDGNVGFSDFGVLASNFNNSLALPELDFGDAPESGTSFPTTLPNGARHVLGSGLFLGALVDGELNGQPDAAAAGDGADEDGVALTTLTAGSNATVGVTATVSSTAVLNAWIDFNRDGDWDDAGEQVFVDETLTNGSNSLTIAVPAGASVGPTFARFRITSCAGSSYRGLAADGEVEDYQVSIAASSFARTSGNLASGLIGNWKSPATDAAPVRPAGSSATQPLWQLDRGLVDQAIAQLATDDQSQAMIPAQRMTQDELLIDQVLEEVSY